MFAPNRHKCNNEALIDREIFGQLWDKASRLDESSQLGVAVEEVGIGAADTNEMVPIQSQFLKKLDVIIANQNTMTANQNVIVAELENLVQVIAEK